ncbi:hypothetical protein ACIQGO_33380 [Streptomyces shenzhenensis]|uniref:hypothetical protein n=1 Tax=Streptomyces shenzhenensis TaxID=943815 RepID=UPI0038030ACE
MAGLSAGPEEELLAVFDWLALGHANPGFRGCPFTSAAVELPDADHPARAVILDLLLIDGANARVVQSGDCTAMRRAGSAASRLMAAARTPCGRDTSIPDTSTPKYDREDPEG